MTAPQETFLQEMKRYLGFTEEDAARLRQLGPRMEPFAPELAERFYAQIPQHPNAVRVFTGGEAQILRLKRTLQHWARGLFCGVYDQRYAEERFQIGHRHVLIGLDQKYVISAMSVVRAFLLDCLGQLFPDGAERLPYVAAVNKILDLDLNLMCESYMESSLRNLRTLNEHFERSNRDLAQAVRIKNELMAQTSHELRTPLNSILGFTRLILDGLAQSKDEERALLRDVYSSAQHLLRLVNDVLDYGRMEAGRIVMLIEDLDPRNVLDSTLPLMAMSAAEKSLEVADLTRSVRLPLVRADEVRLRQVLLNLLVNAVKFTPAPEPGAPPNRITISALTLPGSEEGGGFLRLEILDTGVGVASEQREAVFESFVQEDPVTGNRLGGAGLGLAISRKLVEFMGGRIGLEPNPAGRGTLVWFTLPLAPALGAAASPETGKLHGTSR